MISFGFIILTGATLLILTELALLVLSTKIEVFLESYKTSRLKTITRHLYNVHFQVLAILTFGYNILFNRGSTFKGTYGGVIDYMLIFPIKSTGHGIKVTEWEVVDNGLKFDRQYALFVWDSERNIYKVITMRTHEKLALLNAKLNKDLNSFEFEYPNLDGSKGSFELPTTLSSEFIEQYCSAGNETVRLQLWLAEMEGYVIDKIIHLDFYKAMGLPDGTKLVYSPSGKECTAYAPKSLNRTTYFQDYYPFLMCSQESFNDVKLKGGESTEYLQMESYRPTIIIKDVEKPYIEDLYYKFDIISSLSRKRF
ncbi:hypothetical protein CANARDRAFT_20979 [[Candida] arabinofermentans NRRL YB-2248]|uniref:Molybdenum cofactor sulfurase middle domain-containing protein n=1 Tax=[Candida] arabinofermentans NRRL YB-2248 TaxID=983967 RepID=A0A1E4T939_9ASCO|nr:hypothetical protein CANARDRAFT_20979 [[Candida] arabinofermentans NRRL YB-2248]